MSTLSEGELHVQAMRLVCEALADREKTGLEVDWDVINQQLDHMDVILQGIADQRVDDADEIKTLRKELDAARAEILHLWGAIAADDKRLRDAEERIWPGVTWGCDAPDKMADEIETLRQQLAEQQAETVDVRRQRNNETDRLNATNAVSVQQRDEIAYLRTRLDEERSVSAGLRQQLDAASAAVTLQRAGIERLRRFVGGVEGALGAFQSISPDTCCDQIARCLSELEDSLAPVAEPATCPECEPLQAEIERLQGFVNLSRRFLGDTVRYANVDRLRAGLAELDAGTEPTPVAEPVPCPECERLQAFVGKVRKVYSSAHPHNWMSLLRPALAELDAEGGA